MSPIGSRRTFSGATGVGPSDRPVRPGKCASRTQIVRASADVKEVKKEKVDARAFRRSLNKTNYYTRAPVNDEASMAAMERDGVGYSTTGLVAQMRKNNNTWKVGDITVNLAKAYGFCWGVERSVQMAYEAKNRFPDRQLHLTNEIIHNPGVNSRLADMGVQFVDESNEGKDFSDIKEGDVVLLPAFGATVQEMRTLSDRGVQIVDTTCPWVSKVWYAVDKQAQKEATSIIHGKWNHEETIATASFATTYVIVRDMAEAQYVCDYILNGGSREEFLEKFKNAYSEGFDPETMLDRVGVANQTTMLKGETQAIGKLLEKTMMQKYGPEELGKHFMVMDTICDATQERQDAMFEITAEDKKPDIMLVVGGFNSSNTSHLQEIAEEKGIPSFWVDTHERVNVEENTILHKTSWGELMETKDWLPKGPVTIGVTSGASTPDASVEKTLDRVFRTHDPTFKGVLSAASEETNGIAAAAQEQVNGVASHAAVGEAVNGVNSRAEEAQGELALNGQGA